ncbi:MAG: dihydrolipoyl dehydrogenase [Pseudomonadota bacterium]|jgi:dihydrolipoamide dehydrogenase
MSGDAAANQFDVIIIGAGPGGYVAAIRAAQLGLKTACVESRGTLGGTCLNVGCIPSKALLQSSEAFSHVQHKIAEHGVRVSGVELDLPQMMKRKDEVVKGLTRGIEGLFRKNKITWLQGHGRFAGPAKAGIHQVAVDKADGSSTIHATKTVIIATGSEPVELKAIAPFDHKFVIDSTDALALDKVPGHLVVIGAGVIGLEMGSVWKRLGAKVTVIEAADRVLPPMDGAVSAAMHKILVKQGMEFLLGAKLTGAKPEGKSVRVDFEHEGAKKDLKADKVLVAVGRRPNTFKLGMEAIGLSLQPNGRVPVDGHFKTPVAGVYAIGDVIDGLMLAHKAEDEGIACAEIIAGKAGHVNYDAIPNVVYTWPEVASVGITEEQAKSKGLDYKTGQFPFAANGRAKAMGDTDGFVKIIADGKTDRLLGVHMVGPNASELIAEAAIAFEFAGSAEDLARSSHAHPTLAEAIKEAALGVDKRTIHM